jgi:hypothetical protein
MEPRARSESAAGIEVTDRLGSEALRFECQPHEDGCGLAVGVGIENERADVSVETLQLEAGHLQEATDDPQGLAIVGVEAKLGPDRMRAGIEIDAQGDRDGLFTIGLRRDFSEQKQFVQIVDLDHGAGVRRAVERFRHRPKAVSRRCGA